jgi:hypothetical protein
MVIVVDHATVAVERSGQPSHATKDMRGSFSSPGCWHKDYNIWVALSCSRWVSIL